MFCTHWMGDVSQATMPLNTVFCNCDEPEICTCNVRNERNALLYVLIMVSDGNEARAKTVLHFYTVFQVCDYFFVLFL